MTISRLATELEISRQAVSAHLEGYPPTGKVEVRGQFVNAWSILALPSTLARRLDAKAEAGNYRNVEAMLRQEKPVTASKPAPRPAPVSAEADLSALTNHISLCANPASPTELEWRGIWARAFEEYERLTREGWTEDEAARAVRDTLAASPCFKDTNRHALRMQFNRKLERWQASADKTSTALRDRREDNGEPVILPQSDFDQVITCAGRTYCGDVAPALRYLIGEQKLSTPALARYGHVLETRGYVPKIFAEKCGYKSWLYYMHRMDKLDEETSGTTRDWSALPSLRVYSADDLTPCVYFSIADGRGWFRLVRGQLLVFEDFSSGMILGYSLQPDAQYNSLVIRSLCTHVFSKYGVPAGLYFENGLWRKSSLLKGRKDDTSTHAEMTRGLEDLGIRFTHTKHPWSKPIEKSFDALQTLMQSEPGYCGREEKYDLPPEMKRAKQLVDARKASPEELGLHSYDSWKVRIAELCDQFNRTPQHGERCGGLSPAEVCEMRLTRDVNGEPILGMRFTPEVRHKLALHRECRRVTAAGIQFQFGKKNKRRNIFKYRGEETAHLIGQWVMTGFDPENPEMLTVEDPTNGLVICVARDEKVNPLEKIFAPDSDALAREHARIDGQVAELRAYFKTLDCPFVLPRNVVIADALTIENGRRIAASREKIREEKILTDRAVRFSERIGAPVSPESLREVSNEELNQAAKFVAEPVATETKKTYVLNAPAVSDLPQLRAIFLNTWREVEKAKPEISRYAITHRALGKVVPVNEMTGEQLTRCIEVFTAIKRGHQQHTTPNSL